MQATRIAILAVLLAPLFTAPAAADVSIEMTVTYKQTGQLGDKKNTSISKSWIKPDRMASRSQKGPGMVWRFDKKLIWTIQNEGKNYTEQTFAEFRTQREKAAAQMKASLAQYEQMLKNPNLPDATKKSLRTMLEGLTASFSVKVGAKTKILGYDCTHYTILRNDKPTQELWACESLEGGAQYQQMMEIMGAYGAQTKEITQKIKGIVLKYKFESKNPQVSMSQVGVATKITTDELEDKHFEIPEGFSKGAKAGQ